MAKLVRTEEENMLAESARGFLDKAAPVTHLRGLRDSNKTHDAELWKQMAEMGWAGILIPEDAGGSDMGVTAACVLSEEMGKTLATSPFLSSSVIAATALRKAGDDRAHAALKGIANGTRTYALAIDEHNKFNPDATKMTAEAVGNGFRLNGRKQFVVDGGFADRLIVLARTGKGMTVFDLPADAKGIERKTTAMIDSRDCADIDFKNVEATGEDIIGTVDRGMDILAPALEAGQAVLAAEMSGVAAGAFGMTVEYLKDRKQFDVPIGSFQALQHRAAHLWCEMEVTASAILHAGRAIDDGLEDAGVAVSLAKARATETVQHAVKEGLQMHGGMGMTDEFDMGLFMKRARASAEWLGDYGYHAKRVAEARGF